MFLCTGSYNKNEVPNLDVQFSSAQLQLFETENGIQMAKLNLLNNLNLPMETDISLKPLTTMEEMQDIPSLEVINSQALNTRSELKAMAIRIKSRETAVKMTESAWYPDIYLIGNYSYARPNQRIVPTKDQFDGTWDVTLSLSNILCGTGMPLHTEPNRRNQIFRKPTINMK